MTCAQTLHVLAALFLAAWLCWFPWAFTERPAPKWSRIAAAVLAVGAVLGAAFVMPGACPIR